MLGKNFLSWNGHRSWQQVHDDPALIVGRDLCIDDTERCLRGPITHLEAKTKGLVTLVTISCAWVVSNPRSEETKPDTPSLLTGNDCQFEVVVLDMQKPCLISQGDGSLTFSGLSSGTSKIMMAGDNIAHPDRT